MAAIIKEFFIPAALAVVTALSSYMVHSLKESRKVNDANARGTMLLLRRQIISDHDKYCIKGEPMKHFDFEDINDVYDTYKALGGNGLTDKMFKELQEIDLAGGEE